MLLLDRLSWIFLFCFLDLGVMIVFDNDLGIVFFGTDVRRESHISGEECILKKEFIDIVDMLGLISNFCVCAAI